MVRVYFSSRILCDSDFMRWVLKHPQKVQIISKLMRIKANSKEHKKEHNVILDFDYREIKDITKEEFIRGAVKEICFDDYIKLPNGSFDGISKRVIFSVLVLNSTEPFNTYIFTVDENKEKYENNEFFKSTERVRAKSGESALELINSFFRQYTIEKSMSMSTC